MLSQPWAMMSQWQGSDESVTCNDQSGAVMSEHRSVEGAEAGSDESATGSDESTMASDELARGNDESQRH